MTTEHDQADSAQLHAILEQNLTRIAGVSGAVLLSKDGLVRTSYQLPRDSAERVAAAVSGIASSMAAVAQEFGGGEVTRHLAEITPGLKACVTACGEGSTLIVVARGAKVGELGGETVRTAQALGPWLGTPERQGATRP
ncbi:hypothetical protein AQ490_04105 [Wenjunlia vitaminophila]|uniref:Roadblock/LAMTOR2 domain-containing protein n=1 Tax=Wenjunlia vitaminophila TaxID=76728 RepID=A0A0T6LRM3_WENVI|nr:roadblock/LC7 domain-containing protein [Wenjunlia vitaminophila]KRV48444.1 hypothetical protein AQ490_04105 [Wenjunlia vitaminophila]